VLTGQLVHAAEPEIEYLPGAQFVHVAFNVKAYWPAGQLETIPVTD
jgi:hypothetical protein